MLLFSRLLLTGVTPKYTVRALSSFFGILWHSFQFPIGIAEGHKCSLNKGKLYVYTSCVAVVGILPGLAQCSFLNLLRIHHIDWKAVCRHIRRLNIVFDFNYNYRAITGTIRSELNLKTKKTI